MKKLKALIIRCEYQDWQEKELLVEENSWKKSLEELYVTDKYNTIEDFQIALSTNSILESATQEEKDAFLSDFVQKCIDEDAIHEEGVWYKDEDDEIGIKIADLICLVVSFDWEIWT